MSKGDHIILLTILYNTALYWVDKSIVEIVLNAIIIFDRFSCIKSQ